MIDRRQISNPGHYRLMSGLLLTLTICGARAQDSVLIRGARIVDGSGKPPYESDVRIVAERIAGIGSFQPRLNEKVIEAQGRVLAPGFIDIHNHSQEGLD